MAERLTKLVGRGLESGRCYLFSDGDYSIREIVDAMRSAAGFAFCPNIPTTLLRRVEPLVDPVFSRLTGRPSPIAHTLRRLTDSFVVAASNFAADYGELAPLDLMTAMRRVQSNNVRGRT